MFFIQQGEDARAKGKTVVLLWFPMCEQDPRTPQKQTGCSAHQLLLSESNQPLM